jgi:hypothetical protein
MSYEKLFRLGEVVKASVNENNEAKMKGFMILESYEHLTREELSDKLYELITVVAAYTATRILDAVLGEEEMNTLEETLKEAQIIDDLLKDTDKE